MVLKFGDQWCFCLVMFNFGDLVRINTFFYSSHGHQNANVPILRLGTVVSKGMKLLTCHMTMSTSSLSGRSYMGTKSPATVDTSPFH